MTARSPWIPACEREPIHAPGCIQDWGALLIADEDSHVVRHASANLADFLGISASEAIGRPLQALLEPAWVDRLTVELATGEQARRLKARSGGQHLTLGAHRLDGRIYIEIEPLPAEAADGSAPDTGTAARAAVTSLCHAADTVALFATAAIELRRVTGYERAMVYQFDEIGHGEVIAEDVVPDLEPFLGINYPASDIPRQARALYLQQLVRVIVDATAAPVGLLGAADPGDAVPGSPNLSLSALRAMAPIHLEYLGNMGVRATIAVSLVVEGELWGMLVCHDRAPRPVPAATRELCDIIGRVTSTLLVSLREREARAGAILRKARLATMASRLVARRDDPAALATALIENGDELLALCRASGVIVRLGGVLGRFGDTPPEAASAALLDALLTAAPDPAETLASTELGSLLTPDLAAAISPSTSGALLLPMTHMQGDAIAWLRPEQARTVRWGGNPDDTATTYTTTGAPRPRRSFAVWREDVRGQSTVWRDEHHQAARELRRKLDELLAGYAESMRRARDDADRAMRAKSEFLATMSHEIRSPLSGLLGVLELLRATKLEPEQSRMAGMIHNSASMLLAVLNDILDFSKIEAGALSVTFEPVGLHALVRDLVQPLHVSAARKGLAVSLSIDPDVPEWIETDALRLSQILGNLLSNAVKFTAAGAVSLHVGMSAQDSSAAAATPHALRFTVRDTGIGMTPGVMARLFAPFMQADGSTSRNFGGTGLGLCISRQLALLLGGDLSVVSEPGEGSAFTLVLSLRPCAAPSPKPAADEPAAPTQGSAAGSGGQRVLVVDDDATIRWLSQRQLEKLGYLVDVAEDGESGLRKLSAGGYDLLLTDCHMPRMDGVALTQAIRAAIQPSLRTLPIIGLTADVTERQAQLCHQAGMTALATKPLTVEKLSRLLREHLPITAAVRTEASAPRLASISFDPQIYHSVFPAGDPDGPLWLRNYLDAAHVDADELTSKLGEEAGPVFWTADIARVAHRLAGSSFSVGAMLLGQAARTLERAAPARNETELRVLHAALRAEFETTEHAIRAFVNEQTMADHAPAL